MDSNAVTEVRPTAASHYHAPANTDGNGSLGSHAQALYYQAAYPTTRTSGEGGGLWIAYQIIDLIVKTVATAMLIGILIVLVLHYNYIMELKNGERSGFPIRAVIVGNVDVGVGSSSPGSAQSRPFYVQVDQ